MHVRHTRLLYTYDLYFIPVTPPLPAKAHQLRREARCLAPVQTPLHDWVRMAFSQICASLADISEPKRKQPSPSPLQVKGRQPQAVLLSDSEDDQRVPDTVEKAAPEDEPVDLTSPSEPQSFDSGIAAALRLLQGSPLTASEQSHVFCS